MATIDRNELTEDLNFWLPEGNVFDDSGLLKIAEYIIADVGDDDSNYPEVLCKTLKAVGQANLAKHAVDGGALKQERVGEHSETYDSDAMQDIWDRFLDSLSDICPTFGYRPTTSTIGIGMRINSGSKPSVNDCCYDDLNDLYL